MARPVYKRLVVEEKDLNQTINALLADKWAVIEPPEAQDQNATEFYRKKVPPDEVLDTVNAIVKEGWEMIHWDEPSDDDGDEWKAGKPVTIFATKFEPKKFSVVAMKSLTKTEEIALLREALAEKEEAEETGEEASE